MVVAVTLRRTRIWLTRDLNFWLPASSTSALSSALPTPRSHVANGALQRQESRSGGKEVCHWRKWTEYGTCAAAMCHVSHSASSQSRRLTDAQRPPQLPRRHSTLHMSALSGSVLCTHLLSRRVAPSVRHAVR